MWKFLIRTVALAGGAALAALFAVPAAAHCDGLDGPVVAAARSALERGDPNLVLIWVKAADEAEVREAYRHALAVRRLGPEAETLADRHFFETILRLHRAGEGAPFTGLQPAGRDLGPAIPRADRAVASGSLDELAAFLSAEVSQGVRARFAELQGRRAYNPADVAAGREFVESYVAFVHYVEGIHSAVESAAQGHYPESGESHP